MPSPAIRVSAHAHAHFLSRDKEHIPAPWLPSYYRAILKPYGGTVDEASLKANRGNDFVEMGAQVLRQLHDSEALADVGYLFVAHQTLDTFYPMRSATSLLCQEFGISPHTCAMTEYELSAPFAALKMLLSLLRRIGTSSSALLLALDQAVLPHKRRPEMLPDGCVDSAVVLKFTNVAEAQGPCVEDRHVWIESGCDESAVVAQSMRDFLSSRDVPVDGVHLVADQRLHDLLDARKETSFATYSVADARFMSCAGLLGALEFFGRNDAYVLLAHLAEDGHLFQFLFRMPVREVATCST